MRESWNSVKRLAAAKGVPAGADELMRELSRVESSALQDIQREAALESFRREGEHNLFGVVNVLTELAQALPPDDRFELEARAGRLLSQVE